jgi:hypothetical protein
MSDFTGVTIRISQSQTDGTITVTGHESPGLPSEHVMPRVLGGYISHRAEQLLEEAAQWAINEGLIVDLDESDDD